MDAFWLLIAIAVAGLFLLFITIGTNKKIHKRRKSDLNPRA